MRFWQRSMLSRCSALTGFSREFYADFQAWLNDLYSVSQNRSFFKFDHCDFEKPVISDTFRVGFNFLRSVMHRLIISMRGRTYVTHGRRWRAEKRDKVVCKWPVIRGKCRRGRGSCAEERIGSAVGDAVSHRGGPQVGMTPK